MKYTYPGTFSDEVSGPMVLDEAYVDFADAHGLQLAQRDNVIVTRSFSKSYALAGIRFGFAVAQPALVRELVKVKDSYNCDVLSLAAATAALEDQDCLRFTRARILATQQRLAQASRPRPDTRPDKRDRRRLMRLQRDQT